MQAPTAVDRQTPAEIREHYEIEKSLAQRLRDSTAEQRKTLYGEVYDELFSRIQHHPLVACKTQGQERQIRVTETIPFLQRFLKPDSTFLEVGPGDCALSFAVAEFVAQVYAVDVSEEIMSQEGCPANCELVLSDGSDIPVPRGTVDVCYSKDLLEHLHPADAQDHLRNVYEVLKPGGVYIIRTPNGLSGPHDVSRFFDDVATGLHLKEYSTSEIAAACGAIGFSRITPYIYLKDTLIHVPLWPVKALESVCARFSPRLRRAILGSFPIKRLLSRVIARK